MRIIPRISLQLQLGLALSTTPQRAPLLATSIVLAAFSIASWPRDSNQSYDQQNEREVKYLNNPFPYPITSGSHSVTGRSDFHKPKLLSKSSPEPRCLAVLFHRYPNDTLTSLPAALTLPVETGQGDSIVTNRTCAWCRS